MECVVMLSLILPTGRLALALLTGRLALMTLVAVGSIALRLQPRVEDKLLVAFENSSGFSIHSACLNLCSYSKLNGVLLYFLPLQFGGIKLCY